MNGDAQIIKVQVTETSTGKLRATSPDVIGLHVVAPDMDTLRPLVSEMLTDLFAMQGHNVTAFEADPTDELVPSWVIVKRDELMARVQ